MIIGLTQIKGIGYTFANAILNALKISPHNNIGYLSDEQVQSIEKIVKDPLSANFPSWFVNRRKDVETGKDMHLITSDIDFTVRTDVQREKNTNSWRGYRHMYGLKVRGQRTRTTGRKGGAVGVQKGGKVLPPSAALAEGAAAPAEGAAAPAEGAAAPAEGAAPAKGAAAAKGAAPAEKKK